MPLQPLEPRNWPERAHWRGAVEQVTGDEPSQMRVRLHQGGDTLGHTVMRIVRDGRIVERRFGPNCCLCGYTHAPMISCFGVEEHVITNDQQQP